MTQILGERRFSIADQERFAALSGDRNPIHLDAVAARREFTKQPIVHGAHLLLWSLDAYFSRAAGEGPFAGLRANFEKFVAVGATVRASVVRRQQERVIIALSADDEVVATAQLLFGDPSMASERAANYPRFSPTEPAPMRFEDLAREALRGVCRTSGDGIEALFPQAARALGRERVMGLACASFIVGMVCPGQASIFRSLNLDSTNLRGEAGEMSFEIARLDERFRFVRLSVSGSGWRGGVDAHFRPPPVSQPAIAGIAAEVDRNEFDGAHALIVGGSRGLGELVAKILAAGGARITLTYSVGEADAKRVQAEIAAFGGSCDLLRYDALAPSAPQLSSLTRPPDQLYYMASPAVLPRRSKHFERSLFDAYLSFYVDGLHDLYRALRAASKQRIAIFYPSTVFIDAPPPGYAEYAMAKAAGEILCGDLRRTDEGCATSVTRLPRLATDQTLSLKAEKFADALDLLLPIVRRVNAERKDAPLSEP
jgi:NAD(P)-dependent dehydrogenase (short-subunit alcohol dehydrogenase family)